MLSDLVLLRHLDATWTTPLVFNHYKLAMMLQRPLNKTINNYLYYIYLIVLFKIIIIITNVLTASKK